MNHYYYTKRKIYWLQIFATALRKQNLHAGALVASSVQTKWDHQRYLSRIDTSPGYPVVSGDFLPTTSGRSQEDTSHHRIRFRANLECSSNHDTRVSSSLSLSRHLTSTNNSTFWSITPRSQNLCCTVTITTTKNPCVASLSFMRRYVRIFGTARGIT